MTTTGLEIKLLADSSAFRNAAFDAADALDKVAASGSRIVDPLVVVSEQATVVADSLQKTADSVKSANGAASRLSKLFDAAANATIKIAQTSANVADNVERASDAVRELATKTRETTENVVELIDSAGTLAVNIGACSRGSIEALNFVAATVQAALVPAFIILGKGIYLALAEKTTIAAGITKAAIGKVKLAVFQLYSSFSLFTATPLFGLMIVGLESARRSTAEALGETTAFQDALEKALEVWERWSEALAGPTLDFAASSLNVLANVLGAVRDVIDGIESVPFLGGAIKGVEGLIGPITVLLGALAAVKAISIYFFGGNILGTLVAWTKNIIALTKATKGFSVAQALSNVQKKLSATWDAALIALGIKKSAATAAETASLGIWTAATTVATAAQVAWNVAKTYAAALTGVGIALVVAASAASAAYAASASSAAKTEASFASATSELGDKVALTKDRYAELAAEIKRSNEEAQTPIESHRAELDAIQERIEAQGKATKTLEAYRKKEKELSDLLAGASGDLTRQQRKDATERLEKLREEREEFEKSYDANLKYSEAAQKRDRETARQNALSSLGIADLVDQKTAAETRDEKLESLKTALDAKLIDEAKYREAVEKVVAEFEETDEEAKKVAEANKKFAKILETNAQKAAEVYAVLDEGIVLEEDRAKIEDALNDELLRATENGKYYADALKSNVPFSERLTAELDDLTETVGLLKDGSKSTAEREAALADARAKLTESLLSETETGKFLIDAQKAQTSVADRLAAAMLEMDANAKAAGMSDETLAAAKTKLTESILQQTEAGKYLLQAEKNLIPKTERLQKAYEEIEATARATGASEDAVAEAKRLAEEDILGKGSPETKAQKDEKPGSNAAAYFGSTAALDAANNRREDKQTPLLKEIATASKKTSAALETVAQKEEPEVFNG